MKHPPPGTPVRLLSRELERVAAHFQDGPVRVAELAAAFGSQGNFAFLAVLALPFLTPIPLLGLAAPAGMIVMLSGIQIALGRSPKLPANLAARELPRRFMPGLLTATGRVLRFLERFLRPRWSRITNCVAGRIFTGMQLVVAGALLLPIPVPFSNALPAAAILLLAGAAMTGDGLAFLAGCVQTVLAAAFLVGVILGGHRFMLWLGS